MVRRNEGEDDGDGDDGDGGDGGDTGSKHEGTDTPHGAHLLSNNVVVLARDLALIFVLFFLYN